MRPIKYRDKMTAEEEAELLGEISAMDAAYAVAAAFDQAMQAKRPEDEELEQFDPMESGWVDKRGRP